MRKFRFRRTTAIRQRLAICEEFSHPQPLGARTLGGERRRHRNVPIRRAGRFCVQLYGDIRTSRHSPGDQGLISDYTAFLHPDVQAGSCADWRREEGAGARGWTSPVQHARQQSAPSDAIGEESGESCWIGLPRTRNKVCCAWRQYHAERFAESFDLRCWISEDRAVLLLSVRQDSQTRTLVGWRIMKRNSEADSMGYRRGLPRRGIVGDARSGQALGFAPGKEYDRQLGFLLTENLPHGN